MKQWGLFQFGVAAALLCAFAPTVHADRLSLMGLSSLTEPSAKLGQTESSGSKLSIATNANLGLGGGLVIEVGSSMVGLEVGLFYLTRNWESVVTIDPPLLGVSELKSGVVTNHFHVPILYRLWLLNFVTFGAGVQGSYGLSQVKVNSESESVKKSYKEAEISQFDYGLVAAAGFRLPLGLTGLRFEVRYGLGINDVNKSDDVYKYRDLQFLAGVAF